MPRRACSVRSGQEDRHGLRRGARRRQPAKDANSLPKRPREGDHVALVRDPLHRVPRSRRAVEVVVVLLIWEVMVGVELVRQRHADMTRTWKTVRDGQVLVGAAVASLGVRFRGVTLLEGSYHDGALGDGGPAEEGKIDEAPGGSRLGDGVGRGFLLII